MEEPNNEYLEQSKKPNPIENLGVVVPTRGLRTEYLRDTLDSINSSSPRPYLVVAGPENEELVNLLERGKIDKIESDLEAIPVAGKIHESFMRMPPAVEFLTWIGDDDLFFAHGFQEALIQLGSDSESVMAYGPCDYINADGKVIFTSKPGDFARRVLSWGPQLIPQPSTVFRRDAYVATGGLSTDFTHAFDFDLFLKLKKSGSFSSIDTTMSAWRWHPDSMTVRKRWVSVSDASKARRANSSGIGFRVHILDLPVRLATYFAGKILALFIRVRGLH